MFCDLSFHAVFFKYTGTVTSRGSETRLNSLSHTIGYVNDNNYLTTWISGIDIQQSNITITFVSGSNLAFEVNNKTNHV